MLDFTQEWTSDIDEAYIYKLAETHFNELKDYAIEKGFTIKKMSEKWKGKEVPTALIELIFKWSEESEFKQKLNELTKSFEDDYGNQYPLRVIFRNNSNTYKEFEEGSWLYNYYQQFGTLTIEVLDPKS